MARAKKAKVKPGSKRKKGDAARGGSGGKGAAAKGGAGPPAPAGAATAPNPYDAFHNKRRRSAVLGQRTVRGEKRNLARSRAKSELLRAQGLLKEAHGMKRKSRFKDARLGGGDDDLADQRSVQRLVKVRQRQTKKSFNLQDASAEELTVGGRPLSGLADEELKGAAPSDSDPDVAAEGGLEEVVARSKQAKAQLAREKREQENMLGKLDMDYSDILGELSFKPKKALAPIDPQDKPDGYDKLVRTLGLERTARATDRTKTPEEIARDRAEKLEALERARVARAEGIDDAPAGGDADDDDDDAPSDVGDGDGGGGAGSGAGSEECGSDGSESGESDESEEEDASEDGEAEVEPQDADDQQGVGCPKLLSAADAAAIDITVNGAGEEGLRFAPDCPGSCRGVEALLGERPPRTCLKLVQRVRACTASALGPEKRTKLRAFFVALLEYAVRVMAREDGDLSVRGASVVHALRTPLVEMATEYPEEAHSFFKTKLLEMGKARVPKAEEFCCLKLIALLFPVTDLRHPIVTPAAVLADHWASNLAALGAGIEDLVSEGTMLWGILYDFVIPPRRFCSSFFQLGAALLESCWASAHAGRRECLDAAGAIVALLRRALRELGEEEAVVAVVAAQELLAPVAQRLAASELAKGEDAAGALARDLRQVVDDAARPGLTPMALFETGPAQIKMLDPIFYEEGDRPRKGAELSESKQLARRLTKERRAASRQLARDAMVLQQLHSEQERQVRVKRTHEKVRVRKIMDVEAQELKKMATETTVIMDTSLKRYSAKKEQKVANKRMGGNATADNQLGAKKVKADPKGKAKAKVGGKKKGKGK